MAVFRKLGSYSRFVGKLNGILKLIKGLDSESTILIPDEIENTVDRFPDKTAFIFEGRHLSFAAFEQLANRVANWGLEQDLKQGDAIALVMENCPEYPAIWYGLSKIGVQAALVNSNLEGSGLIHCINIVSSKAVISHGQQAERVAAILSDLDGAPSLWDCDAMHGESFKSVLESGNADRPDPCHRTGQIGSSNCVFIYTSGTTGLPKAAKVTHSRLRRTIRMSTGLAGATQDDIVYNVLPLYHITGGGLGLGATLFTGATSVIRRRFSASEFWDDVVEHKATMFCYIGELCRYLVNSDTHPKERSHALKTGFGNGLRGDVWSEFVDRFNVPKMCELYGSTEGNVSFLNFDGKVGAVGQAPRFLDSLLGAAFVKFDFETEMPVRDKNGFCIKCGVDEVGEVIGRIVDNGRESFEGYQDEAATEKKILRDVFKSGDEWFRTGDLLRRDALGYIYFVDRVGDTFRWKGENVATNEVADAMSKIPGIAMANVYGIEVPGSDGRAGMASVTETEAIDFKALGESLRKVLPAYAVPLFVKVQSEVDTTGTFKFRKVEAVKQGFQLGVSDDPIWFLSPETNVYEPLTQQNYDRIINRDYRF